MCNVNQLYYHFSSFYTGVLILHFEHGLIVRILFFIFIFYLVPEGIKHILSNVYKLILKCCFDNCFNTFDYFSLLFYLKVDHCANVTCLNGGTCLDLEVDFTCQCELGYTGQLCETGKSKLKKLEQSTIYTLFISYIM